MLENNQQIEELFVSFGSDGNINVWNFSTHYINYVMNTDIQQVKMIELDKNRLMGYVMAILHCDGKITLMKLTSTAIIRLTSVDAYNEAEISKRHAVVDYELVISDESLRLLVVEVEGVVRTYDINIK